MNDVIALISYVSFFVTYQLLFMDDRSVDPTLGPFLLTTLQGRYKDLLCKALTATLSGNLKFLPHLTEEETRREFLTCCIVFKFVGYSKLFLY